MPAHIINCRDDMLGPLGNRVHHLCSFCCVILFFPPINRKIRSIFRHSCIQFLLENWLFLIFLRKLNQFGLLQNSSMVYRTSGISYLLGFVWHNIVYHHHVDIMISFLNSLRLYLNQIIKDWISLAKKIDNLDYIESQQSSFWIHPCSYSFMMAILSNWYASRCMLHNFAGNFEMYGILDSVGSGSVDARLSANSTMVCLLNQAHVFCLQDKWCINLSKS